MNRRENDEIDGNRLPADGDRRERFMALLRPAYASLENFAFAMERDRDRAYDLVAETVLRAFEHFGDLRSEEAFLSWLFTIARRLHRRRKMPWSVAGNTTQHADELRSSSSPPDLSADVAALYDALRRLPEKQREALVLFDINDFSLREVLEIQGGSLSALKVRIHRARKRLARILGVEEDLSDTESPIANHQTESGREIAATP